jgi:hypothetical protein
MSERRRVETQRTVTFCAHDATKSGNPRCGQSIRDFFEGADAACADELEDHLVVTTRGVSFTAEHVDERLDAVG